MDFICPICQRRNVYQYLHFQHLHIEHMHYTCEVCKEECSSRKEYVKHQTEKHIQLEHNLIQNWWNGERQIELKVEKDIWVRSMILDSANQINKI